MNPRFKGSVAIMLLLVAGCGVNNQEHQAVISQLAEAKQSLKEINSKLGMASSSDRDFESNLASLQTQLKDLKEQSLKLTEQISKLEAQEDYVFQSAGAKLDAKDFQGALAAYKDFIEKFPSSRRIASANKIIAGIEQKLKTNRRS
jgi:chromosome segregation ATPase